jgi:acrylyl-CoA reductase (NADPH)
MAWRGWFVDRSGDGDPRVTLRDDLGDEVLGDGDVMVHVTHSSLNYKDALALAGRPGIVRAQRLIPGIDVVGTVSASDHPDWQPGDRVLVNGCGLGETHHGGLAQRARLRAEWLVRVPAAMSNVQAAAVGTAGFTAMLAVLELERQGVASGADGEPAEILVTGAAGGVGSLAVALLAARGHRVVASTGRAAEHDYLRSLGADSILERSELGAAGKPLQSQRWGGAIDTVGGGILANVLAQVHYGGTVAACGNAASPELSTTVFPFILRAVRLSGINSVETPRTLRLEAWDALAADLDLALLDSLTSTIGLEDAATTAERILAGDVRGRTVVELPQATM